MADEKPHLHVTFYMEPVEDPKATREQGRPIFNDAEFVKVLIAGDPKNSLIAPAHSGNPSYAQRFPEHYKLFKAEQDQSGAAGTPLTEVPWLTAARRAELKALNIHTVEALASLDGSLLQRIGMGARELKNQAQAWLDMAAGTAVETRLAGENAALKERMESMQAQIDQMLKSGTVAPPTPAAEVEVEPPAGNSPFEAWADDDIKNWIKDNSGSRPPGNPAHRTLVAKADEINAELATRNKAA